MRGEPEAIEHDVFDVLHDGNISRRIAFDHNRVGSLAGFERAQPAVDAQEWSVPAVIVSSGDKPLWTGNSISRW